MNHEKGDPRDTVRKSVSNPDCLFYPMLQSHIYLSEESSQLLSTELPELAEAVKEPELEDYESTFQTQLNRAIR